MDSWPELYAQSISVALILKKERPAPRTVGQLGSGSILIAVEMGEQRLMGVREKRSKGVREQRFVGRRRQVLTEVTKQILVGVSTQGQDVSWREAQPDDQAGITSSR
jgi:hypothetical protein